MTTAESQQLAQQRLADIARRQAALSAKVAAIQRRLTQQLDAASERILGSPATADGPLLQWAKTDLVNTVSQWAGDILAVGASNGDYFRQLATSTKDYLAVQAQAVPLLLNRFGLGAAGELQPGGFFAGFMGDTNLASQVKQLAWKSKAAGVGLQQFKADINALVDGTPDRAGLVQRHFNTFAYDTYQQADAQTQDFYAVKLGLPAALYLGGEIAGTREFCHERQGNVYTREEIAGWAKLEFNGKTPDYNPFTDRGGYNCRHHLHYITARMAAARRTDLTVGPDGKLYKDGEAQPVTVAPARQTAPAVQPPADVQVESSPVALTAAGYTTEEVLAAEAKAGGWELSNQLGPGEFNGIVGGLDLARLGSTMQAELKAANIDIKSMRIGSRRGGVSINISGELADKTIDEASRRFVIERTFTQNRQGERVVSHDYFKVPPSLQGAGLSKKIFTTYYTEYKAAGIELIEVGANLNIGGYTWAKYGFSATNQAEVNGVLANLTKGSATFAATKAEMQKVVTAFYDANSTNTPFPMDRLANIPGAKNLLLGTDWHGSIRLSDAPRRAIFEAYLKK